MFKDGKELQVRCAIPAEVGDKIAVAGLVATRVYIEGRIANTIEAKLKAPVFDDFKVVN